MDCKDFIKEEIEQIKEIADDLKYCNNKELRHKGLDIILYNIKKIEEHLEYLEIKNVKGEEEKC